MLEERADRGAPNSVQCTYTARVTGLAQHYWELQTATVAASY